jgi:hypothetical protein
MCEVKGHIEKLPAFFAGLFCFAILRMFNVQQTGTLTGSTIVRLFGNAIP